MANVIAETERLNQPLWQKTRELERNCSLLTQRDKKIDQLRLRLGNTECDSYSKAKLEHRFNALLHDNNRLQGEFNAKIQQNEKLRSKYEDLAQKVTLVVVVQKT